MTPQLGTRPSRPPDFEAENRALADLAKNMQRPADEILTTLAETALRLCRAGSCGISIIEEEKGVAIFRWHALVGALAEHRWETTPRNFSPCGTVVDTNAIQLMSSIDRHFTYFAGVKPAILEALLVPFALHGKTVGTIWVVMHDPDSHFDAEDGRLLSNLGEFTAAAYQAKSSFEQLADSDRRKDEFLATLAHELRNPLAAAQTAGQFLNASLSHGAIGDLQRASALQQRQLMAMGRMIDDLMDVSRVSRNRLEIRRGRVELVSVILDAIEMNRVAIEAARHELKLNLPDEPIWIDGDETRLAQIFSNLLHNAAKFTPPQGRIELETRLEPGNVAIVIRDNGLGISPSMVSRIFDPFSQVETARAHAQGGLGIGLSLVKHLTDLHGGSVQVFTEGEGRGTEFTVRLPLAAEAHFSQTAGKQAETNDAAVKPSLRILVADDNHDAADAMCLLLQLTGYEVRVCYDGATTLEQVASFQPHVLLQDIAMPGIDGLEIARRLRAVAATRKIVLVALSGFGQPQDLQRSQAAGFEHHLVKPVDFERMGQILSTVGVRIKNQSRSQLP
ncbi:MAG: luxQ 1 [Gammaproteobacteria bacterium]|nr:luxQ 1 [Gammaproteobacteria bacterium]